MTLRLCDATDTGWVDVPSATRHGVLDATTDIRQIRAWWRANPKYNVGLATGYQFDALDVDIKDGRRGRESLAALRDAGLIGGAWALASTPSGGCHVLFDPSGDGNHVSRATGLDFRGRGGLSLQRLLSPTLAAIDG